MSQHNETEQDEMAALAKEGLRREQSGEQSSSTYRIKHFQDGWHAIRKQVFFADGLTVTMHMFPFSSKQDAERFIAAQEASIGVEV